MSLSFWHYLRFRPSFGSFWSRQRIDGFEQAAACRQSLHARGACVRTRARRPAAPRRPAASAGRSGRARSQWRSAHRQFSGKPAISVLKSRKKIWPAGARHRGRVGTAQIMFRRKSMDHLDGRDDRYTGEWALYVLPNTARRERRARGERFCSNGGHPQTMLNAARRAAALGTQGRLKRAILDPVILALSITHLTRSDGDSQSHGLSLACHIKLCRAAA